MSGRAGLVAFFYLSCVVVVGFIFLFIIIMLKNLLAREQLMAADVACLGLGPFFLGGKKH